MAIRDISYDRDSSYFEGGTPVDPTLAVPTLEELEEDEQPQRRKRRCIEELEGLEINERATEVKLKNELRWKYLFEFRNCNVEALVRKHEPEISNHKASIFADRMMRLSRGWKHTGLTRIKVC